MAVHFELTPLACAAALLLLFDSHGTSAQAVQKCRNADGTISYQDRPCAAGRDAGVHVIHATPAGEVPRGVKAEQAFVATNQARRAPPPRSAAEFFDKPGADAPPIDNRGYRCSVGKRVFYQMTPCPALAPDGEYTTLSGYTGREEHVGSRTFLETDTVQLPHMRPTEQKVITRAQACEGQRAELDPYTRYTTSNPCRGL